MLEGTEFYVSALYTIDKHYGEILYKWGVKSKIFVGFVEDDGTVVICYGDNISTTTSLKTEKAIELREILEQNKIQYKEEPNREVVAKK